MKRLLFTAFIITGLSFMSLAQTDVLPAADLMKNACLQAAKENKKVFVMFHASWCGWCHKMDASMNDVSCRQFFTDKYIIVHLVVSESKGKEHLENPGAEEMKTKYHGEGQGIPFWLVFDKDGSLLADSKMRKEGDGPAGGDNTGCPASEKEVEYFIGILKKTSSITASEEDVIRKRFRKNDM